MDTAQVTEIVNTGIRAATAAIELYIRAQEASQAGNEEDAMRFLTEARMRFSQAVTDWENAG